MRNACRGDPADKQRHPCQGTGHHRRCSDRHAERAAPLPHRTALDRERRSRRLARFQRRRQNKLVKRLRAALPYPTRISAERQPRIGYSDQALSLLDDSRRRRRRPNGRAASATIGAGATRGRGDSIDAGSLLSPPGAGKGHDFDAPAAADPAELLFSTSQPITSISTDRTSRRQGARTWRSLPADQPHRHSSAPSRPVFNHLGSKARRSRQPDRSLICDPGSCGLPLPDQYRDLIASSSAAPKLPVSAVSG